MDSPFLGSQGSSAPPASPSIFRPAIKSKSPQVRQHNFTSQHGFPTGDGNSVFFNPFGNQQRQQTRGSPDSGPAALVYANAQLSYYAASQQHQQRDQSTSSGNNINNININDAAAFYAPSTSTSGVAPATPGRGTSITSASSSRGAAAFAPQLSQLSQLPHGVDLGNLTLQSSGSSAPPSASSSPGWTHRRLPSSSSHLTHAHNPRIVASSVTGKRLNWGEMICATIYHSEHGRLIIQDLFTQMCQRFPEVQEWAFGKDWEARVKNRIKSTLSIKGHVFIKVPRPSSAAGKGSWWTLSQEAQDAFKENRLGPLLKISSTGPGPGPGPDSAPHSRSGSTSGAEGIGGFSMSIVTSAAPSRLYSPVPGSFAATQIRQHATPHPLAQHHVEALNNLSMNENQACQAAQLAQLQPQLLQQQLDQRDAFHGSYHPNAAPSGGGAIPPLYFDDSGQVCASQSGSGSTSGFGGSDSANFAGAEGFPSPMDNDSLMAALQIYGSPFPGNGAGFGEGGVSVPGGDKGGKSGGGGESICDIYEGGSFGATCNALQAFPGTNDPRKQDVRMSDSSVTESLDEASALSSNPTTGTGSSSGSSYGIRSPQVVAHLGGPQPMPFLQTPARPASGNGSGDGPENRDVNGENNGIFRGFSNSQAAFGGGSAFLLSHFDSSSAASALNGPGGPGGIYSYPANGDFYQSFLQGSGGGSGAAQNPFGVSLASSYPTPISGQHHPHGQQAYAQEQPNQSQSQQSGQGQGKGDQSSGILDSVSPSPGDSTSAFFAFTPAAGPVDAQNSGGSNPHPRKSTEGLVANGFPADETNGDSALGPMVGSDKRRNTVNHNQEAFEQYLQQQGSGIRQQPLQKVEDGFSLPPPA